MVTWKKSGS